VGSSTLVVLDPTLEAVTVEARLAPRPGTLDGQRVGFLDNSKLNSDRFLALLEVELAARYRMAETIHGRKSNASRVCPEETLLDMASRCDVLITAVGD
jgi:hypothetical protein